MAPRPLAASRPWIKALSIYGNDYANNVAYRDVNVRRHTDGKNHFSVPIIPSENDGEHLQSLLEEHLPWLVEGSRPDLVLFQAGVDPLRDDPYSPLNLDHRDLFLRDKKVFDVCASQWPSAGLGARRRLRARSAKSGRRPRQHRNGVPRNLQLFVDTLIPSFEN